MAESQRILIVEDDQFLRELYAELLKDEGFEIDEASDGQTGLDKISEGGYDLVLLDIMLPKRDGLDILRQIKNQPPKKANGSVVLLTNLGQEEVIKEGFSLGAVGYLIKSAYTPDQVLHEVRTFLAKGNAH